VGIVFYIGVIWVTMKLCIVTS